MKTRMLRDIEVSEIGMGCMAFSHGYGKIPPEEYSIKAIQNAYAHGCTFFDTAEVYSPNLAGIGHNERKLASAIRGIGAFRRFKDTVNYLGIADKWYTFRDNALKEKAIHWCREKGLIPEPVNEAGYPDRPYVICHMVTSIDGKVTGDFLLHKKCKNAEDAYYQLNREYAADAFACGRVTMEGSFTQGYKPDLSNRKGERIKREDYIADANTVFGSCYI